MEAVGTAVGVAVGWAVGVGVGCAVGGAVGGAVADARLPTVLAPFAGLSGTEPAPCAPPQPATTAAKVNAANAAGQRVRVSDPLVNAGENLEAMANLYFLPI